MVIVKAEKKFQVFGNNKNMENKNLFVGITIFLIILIFLLSFIFKKEKTKEEVFENPKIIRESQVSGTFYPWQKEELESQIESLFENVNLPEIKGKIKALILPHAGYDFSGNVAAFGYKAIFENFKESLEEPKTIFIIGPSHYYPIEGLIIDGSDFWQTPFGEVEVDKEVIKSLIKKSDLFKIDSSAHKKEHSLEVQLPFLQKIFSKFKIVPILVNELTREDIEKVSDILSQFDNDSTIFIASSDMSHYPSYQIANYADNKVISAILSRDINNLEKTIQDLEKENLPNAVTFLCGKTAVEIVMALSQKIGVNKIELLKYANSANSPLGNKNSVVGYSAIAFLIEEKQLSKEDQKILLKIARETVETYIREGKIPEYKIDSLALNEKLGAFVTIKKHGNLRGCIGRFSPVDIPLYQVVAQMAIAAATQDLRFFPVQPEELKDLKYEISVLSPLKEIDDWKKIKIGRDGVEIVAKGRAGVFLPQVATENNWDLETFLSELCLEKLSLPKNCYQDKDAKLYTFTAQVFGEE
jgi:AmmeMemoRadiSam system protein B/AmmeMemoRadiSam system protein A